MRSAVRIAVCAILLAGLTAGSAVNHVSARMGYRILFQVLTYDDDVVKCYLHTNRGFTVFFKPIDESSEKFNLQPDDDRSKCSIAFLIEKGDIGMWTLVAEDINGRQRIQQFDVSFDGTTEDYSPDPTVVYYDERIINTIIGANHIITIPDLQSSDTRRCEIFGPDGIRNNVFALNNTEVISRDFSSSCSVSIQVKSVNEIGRWRLVSVGLSFDTSMALDRLQPFQIRVEGHTAGLTIDPLPPVQTTVRNGERLLVQVLTFNDDVLKCHLLTNNGNTIEFKPTNEPSNKFEAQPDNDSTRCSAKVLIEAGDTGLWTLTSESSDGRTRVQRYNITIDGTPDSSEAEEATVMYLDEKIINTTIGSNHTITIPDFEFGDTTNCMIYSPDGVPQNVYGLNNTEVISKDLLSTCSVSISVTSTNAIGNWRLVSKGHKFSEAINRIQPFQIRVEKFVSPAAEVLQIREGLTAMYLSLEHSVPAQYRNTCKLLAPNGAPPESYTRLFEDQTCAYQVFNVTTDFTGDWEISYGDTIKYRAITNVIVHAAHKVQNIELTWINDRPLNVTLGPETAVYCRVKNPQGFEVYNGFGRCVITLPRVVQSEHRGLWTLDVGLVGQVLTQQYKVNVMVQDPPPKPTVSTNVTVHPNDKHLITLTCAVSSPDPVHTCKFRDPKGRILIATEGVGEYRYSWHGSGVNYTSGVHSHECGIRIVNAENRDVGIWRCALHTEADTYFGFLTVKGPWIRDPEIAAMHTTKPLLIADRFSINSMEGDSVTMTCSIRAPIRYCYFRARNGTVFNVAPSTPHDQATYVGAGFDAGECGIRFPSLATSDSGYWSCHVGLLDPAAPEQRARLDVDIFDPMTVDQYLERSQNKLVLQAQVHNSRPLDYCRFVRIDGFGFTNENVPLEIRDRSDLTIGFCSISIVNPSNLEQHPWAIVAKISGREGEVSRVTDIALTVPNPPGGGGGGGVQFRVPGAWIIVMSIGMCMILLASFIGPKKNREWTYARASAIRDSFTKKKVAQNAPEATNNTAVAA